MTDPYWLEAWGELVRTHVQKSGGYGTDADGLANFTGVAAITGDPAWLYPCRRILEKLTRVESLAKQGRVDELAEEFTDIASLALCAEALRRREPKVPRLTLEEVAELKREWMAKHGGEK